MFLMVPMGDETIFFNSTSKYTASLVFLLFPGF